MKLIVNNQIIQKLKDDFPHLSKARYASDNNEEVLRAYFNGCEDTLKKIVSMETLKNNKNLHDYEFFEKIFDFCMIKLNDEDIDLYLKELFEGNYKLCLVDTLVPTKKYDILEQETLCSLKKVMLAVKDTYEIDLNHVFTPKEILLLQNQNLIRFLSLGEDYKEISSLEYSKLKKDYNDSRIIPIENNGIEKHNYLQLINNYPHLFTFIRNNISFDMISDLLLEYETLFSETVNKEIDECNKKANESLKRVDDIKKLTLHF